MGDISAVIDYNKNVITSLTRDSIGVELAGITSSFSSSAATWPTANKAFYLPFRLAYPVIATKMFWLNGATVGTNAVDVGIYDQAGNRLVSIGSTTTSGASTVQTVDITDTTLNPGLYYMAMAVNGTTDTSFRTAPTAPMSRMLGIYEQTSAFALPATATFAVATAAHIPFIGITTKTVI